MHAFRWVIPMKRWAIPIKLSGSPKGKLETNPVEKVPQKEEPKAFEAYLLKKGMELLRDYPIKEG